MKTSSSVPRVLYNPLPPLFRVALPLSSQLNFNTYRAGGNGGCRFRANALVPAAPSTDSMTDQLTQPAYLNQLMRLYSRCRVEVAQFTVTLTPSGNQSYRVAGAIIPRCDNDRAEGAEANGDFDRIAALPGSKSTILGGSQGGHNVLTWTFVVDTKKFITDTNQAAATTTSVYNAAATVVAVSLVDRNSTQLVEAPELRIQCIPVGTLAAGDFIQAVYRFTYNVTFSAPHSGYQG